MKQKHTKPSRKIPTMAPRTPAIIGMTSLFPERWAITGEPETRARQSETVSEKEISKDQESVDLPESRHAK